MMIQNAFSLMKSLYFIHISQLFVQKDSSDNILAFTHVIASSWKGDKFYTIWYHHHKAAMH